MNQVLKCEKCSKTWERAPKRGRKPSFCPTCDPANAPAAVASEDGVTETLTCKHGNHQWTRKLARGRKPPYCPDHRLAAKDAPADETGEPVVKRPKGLPSFDLRPPAVQAILDGPLTELQRKLAYTVQQLENPQAWRDHNDWEGLIKTHKLYCREAERISQTKSTPTVVETED
jgi:hypothetical protein